MYYINISIHTSKYNKVQGLGWLSMVKSIDSEADCNNFYWGFIVILISCCYHIIDAFCCVIKLL